MARSIVVAAAYRRARDVARQLGLPAGNAYAVAANHRHLRDLPVGTTIIVVDLHEWPYSAAKALVELEERGYKLIGSAYALSTLN